MIIVFSGTDGAGKSTQIMILKDKLEKKCFRVKHIWARGGYTPLFMLIKNFIRKLFAQNHISKEATKVRDELIKKRLISKIWLSVAIFDMLIYYGLYVRYLSAIGNIVICDRYVDDTCIDFRRNFEDNFKEKSLLWRLLILLVPKPEYAFLLYVPVEDSLKRSQLKNEPFPDSPDTLAYRLCCYLDESVFSSKRFYKIDCRQSIKEVSLQINKRLDALLNAN